MSIPTVSITIGVNTSPLAGTEGKKLTSKMISDRLREEERSNKTQIKINDTDSPDAFDVFGSSEDQLITLIKGMRREGFELTVSNFQCLFRRDLNDKNKLLEPYEEVVIDVPLDYSSSAGEELKRRGGSMIELAEQDLEVRMVFHVPTRSLRHFKEDFANLTSGFGSFSRAFVKYDEFADPDLRIGKQKGFLISSETGQAVGYALSKLQDIGTLYIKPRDKVYTGMILGENVRCEDIEINATKAKALTTIRASGSDEAYNLTPPKIVPLEFMINYLTQDECIEATPTSLRMRKKVLESTARKLSVKSQSLFKILEDHS